MRTTGRRIVPLLLAAAALLLAAGCAGMRPVAVEDWPAQKPAFAACLEGFAPFHIVIRRLNRFLTPGLVLWLEPEDGGVILRMYRRLEEHFPAFIIPPPPPLSMTPHMSVGFFDQIEDLEEARQKIAAELTCLEFEVTELVFGAPIGLGQWGKVDGIELVDSL